MASLCKFYQRGACHYGQNCRYIHPGENTVGGSSGSASFGNNTFGSTRQIGFAGSNGGGGAQTKLGEGFNLPTQDSIKTDLTERPTWYLSSYAPGKDPPAQLIDGKDISPEEARVMAYRCRAEGSLGVYESEWIRLTSEADTQIRTILNDLPGAVNFMKHAYENRASSRYNSNPSSISSALSPFGNLEQPSSFGQSQQTPAFGQNLQAAPGFGQPSQPTSAFGQPPRPTPAFGSASPFPARLAPAFGQSAFGQTPAALTFGRPAFSSAPASQPQNPFGQPTFGQPPLGKPAFGQPAFGQPAFGQPPALGQTATPFATATPVPTSGFGQTPAQQPASTFGQPPAFGPPNPPKPTFGQPAFGTSPFAQNSPFTTNVPSPQGQPQASSSFTQPQQHLPTASPPFGYAANINAAATPNVFQQAASQSATPPFSNSNPFQQSQQAVSNPFSQTAQAQPSQPTLAYGQPTALASAFGIPQQQPSPFSNQNTFQSAQQQQPTNHQVNPQLQEAQKLKKWDDPIIEYMPMEKDAFAAPAFTLGNVPTVAPSREMCWG